MLPQVLQHGRKWIVEELGVRVEKADRSGPSALPTLIVRSGETKIGRVGYDLDLRKLPLERGDGSIVGMVIDDDDLVRCLHIAIDGTQTADEQIADIPADDDDTKLRIRHACGMLPHHERF